MRGRFYTQWGGLVRTRYDGTHSPGSFSRPPTMVIASRSLPRYGHPLIPCFVTLAPTAPEMAVLMSLPSDYPYTLFSNGLKKLPLRVRERKNILRTLIKTNVPSNKRMLVFFICSWMELLKIMTTLSKLYSHYDLLICTSAKLFSFFHVLAFVIAE